MSQNIRRRGSRIVILLVLGLVSAHSSRGADCGIGPHGGTLVRRTHHQFEIIYYGTEAWVYAFDAKGTPIDASALKASATFDQPNSTQPWFKRSLQPVAVDEAVGSSALKLDLELSPVPTSALQRPLTWCGYAAPTSRVKVDITVAWSANPAQSVGEFTLPFTLSAPPTFAAKAPMPITSASKARTEIK